MTTTYTQEEINDITNLIYAEYYNYFKDGKMSFADMTLVENVIMKILSGFDLG